MKTKITDYAYNLLVQLEPSFKGEEFDRSDLFKFLLNKDLYVSVEYRSVDDFVSFFWSVAPTGYYGSGGRDTIGYNDFFAAFDKGLEYALTILVNREKEKARKAEIERMQKENELIPRKKAEEAMLRVLDSIMCAQPNYIRALNLFGVELNKI